MDKHPAASMKRYDDIFTWEGWGGSFNLGSGQCHLRFFDLRTESPGDLGMLKPFIVVVTDLPREGWKPNQMSVKSCALHAASQFVRRFGLSPRRLRWIEYYPAPDSSVRYGEERFDEASFTWEGDRAVYVRWKTPDPATEARVRELLSLNPGEASDSDEDRRNGKSTPVAPSPTSETDP
jgi:hypothetical protein